MTRAGLVGVTILAVCWPHAGHGQSRENAGVPATSAPVVVASKPFGESYILAEMFSQLLESRGIAVERRAGLGATEIAFGALRVNAIDVYPEYTGTGLLAILQDTLDVAMRTDARATFAYVARVFEERYGVRWLAPLGFENGYAIAVRRETATRYQLRTLTDLARVGGELTAGFTSDFIGRPDGLDGLSREYGLRLEAVRPLAPAVKYAAIAERAVDVIDGYSTDGLLARYDLVTLDDDRNFFPPYQAAAVLSPRLSAERSDAISVLSLLSGRLDEGRMRTYNRRVEVDGEDIRAVAADALGELGLVPQEERNGESEAGSGPDPVSNDSPARVGIIPFLWSRRLETGVLALRHLELVLAALFAALIVAVPLGLVLERARRSAEWVIGALGVLQTIPSIALLAFMIPCSASGRSQRSSRSGFTRSIPSRGTPTPEYGTLTSKR